MDTLKQHDMLDCLQLLHYHLGSQVPNIRDIRTAVMESTRVYAGLVQEGAKMGYLDLGGGLAVDYDGSHTNYVSSRNYSMDEYCTDVVEAVMTILDQQGIEHPHIVTESGRATVAYYSILLFNILDVSIAETGESIPDVLPEDVPEPVVNLREVLQGLSVRNLQECYNDAVYYRDEMRQLFITGRVTLRQRTLADKYFWAIINRIAEEKEKLKHTPKELADIDSTLADIYYGNFSVFQSPSRRVGHRSAVPGHAGAPPDGIPVPQGGHFGYHLRQRRAHRQVHRPAGYAYFPRSASPCGRR